MEEENKECFGDPSQVCPENEQGVIGPNRGCVSCNVVSACLRKALEKKGILSPPVHQHPLIKKGIGFLQRWSELKSSSSKSSRK